MSNEIQMKCVSLFSCAGLGDIGLKAAGVETISACELLADRATMMKMNFPDTKIFQGDIWTFQDAIVSHALSVLEDRQLDLIIASPPCQGYSSNGMGRITSQIKKGNRSKDDPRNRLLIPAINIMKELNPKFIIIENVPGMRHANVLNETGEYESVFSLIHRTLPNFVFRSTVLNTADYGVPQTRRRLITIGIQQEMTRETRTASVFHVMPSFLHATPTHAPVTLRECCYHLPTLDSMHQTACKDDVYHRVPKWNASQYFCMQHTPEGESAFNNKICAHCAHINDDMRIVYCEQCSLLLPRPCTQNADGSWRLVSAFKTSYRRMLWDKAANTLTTNSGVISSDVKGHPEQNRVLSLREIMIVASISGYPGSEKSFEYEFGGDDKLIRDIIGECIPPLFAYKLMCHLKKLNNV